ncbi:hypothetical protein HanRHA438_Chr04g0152471 [Helianthus annuus]|uniref:Uncharacterized protein n=1 Tax=Helianthus annuus TaxID=4232 RepID=A0A251UUQ3_HELAN|nr:hypothetical protein HanXRQr2_Chr04g0141041 [Helianthus annuus]KAJ0586517.1 hypothetical protein HanIR_Chr04g0152781 [Helianthus annuus]KAJ0595235.1 hypothetical protein HanHA89_Chr04g0129161 [Helianthus annuus]KAJ0759697.1 hypothetical protein HanOQP8_Chr04g0129591 [Helianthus annuus]KAJ0924795.1 hypothetical protein HanRHA438_Chr04g0152471 [Helianthus annuus]
MLIILNFKLKNIYIKYVGWVMGPCGVRYTQKFEILPSLYFTFTLTKVQTLNFLIQVAAHFHHHRRPSLIIGGRRPSFIIFRRRSSYSGFVRAKLSHTGLHSSDHRHCPHHQLRRRPPR